MDNNTQVPPLAKKELVEELNNQVQKTIKE
jgi:hypothetical protein